MTLRGVAYWALVALACAGIFAGLVIIEVVLVLAFVLPEPAGL